MRVYSKYKTEFESELFRLLEHLYFQKDLSLEERLSVAGIYTLNPPTSVGE